MSDLPASPSQAMSSPLLSPLAINPPSRDTATADTKSQCPSIFFNKPLSHRRSTLSHEPVTIRRLSGKTATAVIDPPCSVNTRTGCDTCAILVDLMASRWNCRGDRGCPALSCRGVLYVFVLLHSINLSHDSSDAQDMIQD